MSSWLYLETGGSQTPVSKRKKDVSKLDMEGTAYDESKEENNHVQEVNVKKITTSLVSLERYTEQLKSVKNKVIGNIRDYVSLFITHLILSRLQHAGYVSYMSLVNGPAHQEPLIAQWLRVPNQCLGGHGFSSCRELGIFLCPMLMIKWNIPSLSYVINVYKIPLLIVISAEYANGQAPGNGSVLEIHNPLRQT